MSKEVEKMEEKFYLDAALNALEGTNHYGHYEKKPIKELLDGIYIERQADEQWQCVPSSVDKQIKYEIIETGKDEFDSFPYYVREWQEIDTDRWAYAGEGIFCKTLEQANEYIATQDGKAAHGNIAKIKKSDENIREVSSEKGKDKLFIKKHDIWWPAFKDEKGEIHPSIWGVGDDYELMHDNLKRMLVSLESAGVKKIDFSHWNFTAIDFSEAMINQMRFANEINFKNANFCYGAFRGGELKNADFSGATFEMYGIVKTTCRNCNFSNTVWEDNQPVNEPEVTSFIKDSTFVDCKFKNAQFKNIETSNNKFMALDMYIASNMLNKVKTSVLDKLKENQQKVKSRDTDRDTKQRDHSREDREKR